MTSVAKSLNEQSVWLQALLKLNESLLRELHRLAQEPPESASERLQQILLERGQLIQNRPETLHESLTGAWEQAQALEQAITAALNQRQQRQQRVLRAIQQQREKTGRYVLKDAKKPVARHIQNA